MGSSKGPWTVDRKQRNRGKLPLYEASLLPALTLLGPGATLRTGSSPAILHLPLQSQREKKMLLVLVSNLAHCHWPAQYTALFVSEVRSASLSCSGSLGTERTMPPGQSQAWHWPQVSGQCPNWNSTGVPSEAASLWLRK